MTTATEAAALIEKWGDRPRITRHSHRDQIEGIEALVSALRAASQSVTSPPPEAPEFHCEICDSDTHDALGHGEPSIPVSRFSPPSREAIAEARAVIEQARDIHLGRFDGAVGWDAHAAMSAALERALALLGSTPEPPTTEQEPPQ